MPLYEYFCSDCQQTFESLRPMRQADAPLSCKACDSPRTARVLSLFAAPAKGGSGGVLGSTRAGDTGGWSCGSEACGCGRSH